MIMKQRKDQEFITSNYLNNLKDSRRRRKSFITICSALALIVASVTVMEMIQPAAAVTNTESVLDCDFEVHEHTDECYRILYDEEGNETGKELICGQADYVVHTHTDECYKTVVHGDGIEEKVLVCELPEIEEHVHDESCYEEQKVLICEEDHEHTEECYETQKVLVCGQLELHEHTDECYKILYDEEGNETGRELICGKIELLKHEHDENCFKEVEVAAEEETEEAEPAAEETEELRTKEFYGDTYTVRIAYDNYAGIPDEADLVVDEITEEDDLYDQYYLQAEELIKDKATIENIRIFDISVKNGDDTVEPGTPVDVSITYHEGIDLDEDVSIEIVHFTEPEPKTLDNEIVEDTSVVFTTESFSAFAAVEARAAQSVSETINELPEHCIGYLSFDNTTDGFSDSGATAVRHGSTQLDLGHSGNALYLDGSANNYLTVTGENGSLLTGLDEFTISFWVNPTAGSTSWAYYAAPNNNGQTYQQEKYIGWMHSGNGYTAERYNNNGSRPAAVTNGSASPAGEWKHVAVVYHQNNTEVYIDGELSGSAASAVDLTNMLGNNSIFQIGRANWGGGEGFTGYIDEFSVYDYALGAEEISWLKGSTGTIALSPMNENGVRPGDLGIGNVSSTHYKNMTIDGHTISTGNDIEYSRIYIPVTYNERGIAQVTLPSNDMLGDFTVSSAESVHHSITQDPDKYHWVLKGWVNIATNEYYDVSSGQPAYAIVSNENLNVFYADWVAEEYDYTLREEDILETKDTSDFISIKMFDYNELYNLPGASAYKIDGNQYTFTPRDSLRNEEWYIHQTESGQGDFVLFVDNTDSSNAWQYGTLGNTQGREGGNYWSNYSGQVPREGIVGEKGEVPDNGVLESLFSESNSPGTGVTYLGTSNYLFSYNEELQEYSYDSALNGAVYNKEEGRFYVATTPKEHVAYLWPNPNAIRRGFLPYNDFYEDLAYNNGSINYWFGMKIDLNFWLPDDPGTADANQLAGEDMKFTFRGDDDVWVLIDDKLILDIGGIHEDIDGTINFSTGIVDVQYRTDGSTHRQYDFTDIIEAGNHTLSFFYVERGGNASNCKIKFNLIPRFVQPPARVNTAKVTKTWSDDTPQEMKEKVKFSLETADGEPVAGSAVTYADGTEEDGVWTYVWEGLDPDQEFVVVEEADIHFDPESENVTQSTYDYWAISGYNDEDAYGLTPILLGNGINGRGKVLNNQGNSVNVDMKYDVVLTDSVSDELKWNAVDFTTEEMHFYLQQEQGGKYMSIIDGSIQLVDSKDDASWFYVSPTGDLNDADSNHRLLVDSAGNITVGTKKEAGTAGEVSSDRVCIYAEQEIESSTFDYTVNNVYDSTELIVKKEWENGTAPDSASVEVVLKRMKLVEDVEEIPTAVLTIHDSFSGLGNDRTYSASYVVTGPDNYSSTHVWNGSDIAIEDLPYGQYTVTKTADPQEGYDAENLTDTQQVNLGEGGITAVMTETVFTKQPDRYYHVIVYADDASNSGGLPISETNGKPVWYEEDVPAGTNLTFTVGVPSWQESEGRIYQYTVNNGLRVVIPYGSENAKTENFIVNEDLSICIYGETPYYTSWLDPAPTVTTTEPVTRRLAFRALRAAAASSYNLSNEGSDPEIEGYTWEEDTEWSETVTLPYEGDWQKTVSQLDKADADGNIYAYYIESVSETGMPSGMTAAIILDGENKLFVYGDNEDNTERDNDTLTVKNTLATETNITILKVEKDTMKPLTGATFSLQKYTDSTYRQADGEPRTGEVDEDGVLNINDIEVGYYELAETETPEGYLKVSENPRFVVQLNSSTKEIEVVFTNTDLVTYENNTFTVQNTPGAELPYTGGPGTTLYTVFGSVLILGAGILLVRKRHIAE